MWRAKKLDELFQIHADIFSVNFALKESTILFIFCESDDVDSRSNDHQMNRSNKFATGKKPCSQTASCLSPLNHSSPLKSCNAAATWQIRPILYTSLRNFGDRTTMHGLAQVQRRRNWRGKMMWLFLTIVGMIACAIHVYLTIDNYIRVPVNTVDLRDSIDTIFPDVTVCSQDVVPRTAILEKDRHTTKKKFANAWNTFYMIYLENIHKAKGSYRDIMKMLTLFMSAVWATYQTYDMGHSITNMLMFCVFNADFCRPINFSIIENHDHWNCYTFRPRQRHVYDPQHGLQMLLYTDNFHIDDAKNNDKLSYNDRKKYPFFGKSVSNLSLENVNEILRAPRSAPGGLRIFVHEPDTYPFSQGEGISAGTGMAVDIVFEMRRSSYVSRPLKPCTEPSLRNENIYWTQAGESSTGRKATASRVFKHTLRDCIKTKKQARYLKKCGCTSAIEPSETASKYCSNMASLNLLLQRNLTAQFIKEKELFINRSNCFVKEYNKMAGDQSSLRECLEHRLCVEDKYLLTTTASPWPNHADVPFLFNWVVIKHFKRNNQRNLRLGFIIRGNESHWNTTKEVVDQNFVKITVSPASSKSSHYQEIQSYSFAEALSEIGGICGLWIGMSVLTIFEFFELFMTLACWSQYRVVNHKLSIQQQQQQSSSEFTSLNDSFQHVAKQEHFNLEKFQLTNIEMELLNSCNSNSQNHYHQPPPQHHPHQLQKLRYDDVSRQKHRINDVMENNVWEVRDTEIEIVHSNIL